MKWTTTRPDRPGHWWHRYAYGDGETQQPDVWHVRDYAGHLAYVNSRLDSNPEVPEEWSDEPIQEPVGHLDLHGCTHGWHDTDGEPTECIACTVGRLTRERDDARNAAIWLHRRCETFDGENEAIARWPWLEYHA